MKIIDLNIKIYLVRSQDGKWFRAKGMSGYGDSWVNDPVKARIYTKIGPARACVTWWTNQYPDYGIPDIVEITSDTGVILDETERVTNAVNKIKTDKIKYKIDQHQRHLESAERKLKEAREEIKKLKSQ